MHANESPWLYCAHMLTDFGAKKKNSINAAAGFSDFSQSVLFGIIG